ncbi:Hypothetical protein CINCED_3A010444 [Cinara cedri]|uniref:Uncharacterized protein n=1 Tax=Cinara cedri TaxID=506608 RepID=A0A5E4MU94_9HEMI|nr:Hypothetical protein CINCED_3A010444 [Cinara cedri]
MSSDDYCRRRGRRVGAAGGSAAAAAAAAAAASAATTVRGGGDQQQQVPPQFPSVCRLVEKYTMLIERHRQKQNGLTPSARRKPSASAAAGDNGAAAGGTAAAVPSAVAAAAAASTLAVDVSSDYSSLSKSAGPCESLGSIIPGSDEDEKQTNSDDEKVRSGNGRRTQLQVVSRLLEVNRTKVKRKRRKSWTGPVGREGPNGGDGVGPCRKGHSLDQGYETTHHHNRDHHQDLSAVRLYHHAGLFRSFSTSSGGAGDINGSVVVLDGGSEGANGCHVPGARQFRTPSVVVSDHSEDPVSFSSMFTLDDLDELETRPDCGFNDSSSDCSAASTWSAAGSVISVLDADYSLHTPERRISGCSTCSGGEDDQDAEFRPTKLKPKVSVIRISKPSHPVTFSS